MFKIRRYPDISRSTCKRVDRTLTLEVGPGDSGANRLGHRSTRAPAWMNPEIRFMLYSCGWWSILGRPPFRTGIKLARFGHELSTCGISARATFFASRRLTPNSNADPRLAPRPRGQLIPEWPSRYPASRRPAQGRVRPSPDGPPLTARHPDGRLAALRGQGTATNPAFGENMG